MIARSYSNSHKRFLISQAMNLMSGCWFGKRFALTTAREIGNSTTGGKYGS